jgi:O-antigen/teichoic acid export membrane protein
MKYKLGYANEDSRNIIINIILSFVVKGGSLIVSLIIMPIYMEYFGDKIVLGVWFTLLSVLNWIMNFDLGIGNGLRNKLVGAIVKRDYYNVKSYISSAYIVLTGIAVIILAIFPIISRHVSWNYIFNITESEFSQQKLLLAVNIVFISISLQFILKLITSILFALQKAFIPNILFLLTNIIIVIFVTTAIKLGIKNDIVLLSWIYLFAVNIPLIVATIIIFSTSLSTCKPNYKYFNRVYATDTLRMGMTFFCLQIMAMILFNTNDFLISKFISPVKVVEYQIYYKIFSLYGTIVALATTPIWSAVTKVLSEKNYIWIKKLSNILLAVGFLGILLEISLIPVLQYGFNFWLGDNTIKVNYMYAFIFALSGGIFLWCNIITCIANGSGKLKIQLIYVAFGAIVNIPIAYVLTRLTNSYISIVIANIISIMPYCIIQPIWFARYINKMIKQQKVSNTLLNMENI